MCVCTNAHYTLLTNQPAIEIQTKNKRLITQQQQHNKNKTESQHTQKKRNTA